MDILQRDFAERIKEAQERLGLSQAALARKWGFPKQTISAWINGISAPSGLYREKLSVFSNGLASEKELIPER